MIYGFQMCDCKWICEENLFFLPVCPPMSSMDPRRRQCFFGYHRQVLQSYSDAQASCKEFKWMSDGHLPVTKTLGDIQDLGNWDHLQQPWVQLISDEPCVSICYDYDWKTVDCRAIGWEHFNLVRETFFAALYRLIYGTHATIFVFIKAFVPIILSS